jgi:hypothetical protein
MKGAAGEEVGLLGIEFVRESPAHVASGMRMWDRIVSPR